jgi:phosphate-selective porin OprO/OprP
MHRHILMHAVVALAALLFAGVATGQPTPRGSDDERGRATVATSEGIQLTLGGYLQVDGRWVGGSAARAPDGLLLRRARLVFDAARDDGWHVRLQPDFGQGRVLVQDAFVGWMGRGTTVRLGRFRPAFGTERMQSSSTLLFPERSQVNALMPSRSFGGQFQHSRGRFRVAAGGFRTPIGSDVPTVDTDGDVRAVGGRGHDLLLHGGWRTKQGARYVDLQGSVLAGREQGSPDTPALTRLLSVSQLPLVVFRDDNSVAGTSFADGNRGRASVGGVAGTARWMTGAEVAHLWQMVRLGERRENFQASAVSLRAALVLGGTRAATQEVTPRGRRGALEFGVRTGLLQVRLDERVPLLVGGAPRYVRTAGVVASWIPTATTRLSAGIDVTNPNLSRTTEHAAVVRWQQAF